MKKLGFLFLFCLSSFVCAKQELLNNDPVEIKLPIGQEIRVEYPEMVVDLNVPSELNDKIDIFMKPNGVIYWTAKKTFTPGRVIATTANGDVSLLDVVPTDEVQQDELVIKLISEQQFKHHQISDSNEQIEEMVDTTNLPDFLANELEVDGDTKSTQTKVNYSYADMAAYAFQHYLGPQRLISNIPATRVNTPTPSKRFVRVWQDRLSLKLLNAWQIDGKYITAIGVKNKSYSRVPFDPRSFRGHFLFASSLHDTLEPKGSKMDMTVWVFITDVPFNAAVGD